MQVQAARMQQLDPANTERAMRAMFGLGRYLDQAGLEESLLDLVKTRASQINGCANCLDMHTKDARARGESEQRLYLLAAWRECPFDSARERAARRWTEAVRLVADGQVPDAVYEEGRQTFSDDELLALTMAVITINAWNRLSIGLRVVPGSYQPNDPAIEQLRAALASSEGAMPVAVATSRPDDSHRVPMSRSEQEAAVAEARIRQRVEDVVQALRAKDLDGVMSVYAPDVVSFDLGPPLRYGGADQKRRAWHEVFAAYPGPIAYEVRDVTVTTHGELAVVHSLNHINGTLAGGQITDLWLRWTACFRRIDGVWLVVPDHVSVPADVAQGQALLHLTP